MKTEELIDKLFGLLGEMHDDLLEHKCENVESYNQEITELFEQSAAVRQALEHDKTRERIMKIAKVYDNGGQTFDRYTIIFKDCHDALGLSDNCDSPQGFSQFGVAVEGRHLGRQIAFAELPENVRLHIYERIT